jgi:glycosyltransferase involved in cell wall biosynthesis
MSGRIESWLANSFDHTFVVSDAVSNAAKDLGFDPSRVTNVGHDINRSLATLAERVTDFTPRLSILQNLGIDGTHFLVGAVTRLESHKGVDTLIDAAVLVQQEVPNARFLVRGRGPERERLTEQIAACGLGDVFYIIEDWLSEEDLVDLYRSFDVFALPTRREGFGMAFAEAMLLGVVPIAPDIPPVNEVVTPQTGLLVPPSPKGFADAIIWASQNSQALEKVRSVAQREAVARWGGSRAADKVLETYCDLVAQKT